MDARLKQKTLGLGLIFQYYLFDCIFEKNCFEEKTGFRCLG